jgi:hypothetical protein
MSNAAGKEKGAVEMADRYKETRKKTGLKGMFKTGSRKPWTITGRVIYYVPLPELAAIYAKSILTRLLRAFGFYARKCGCRDGHGEWPLKFRLCRCGDCRRKGDE